ncbi:MAG TPA: hypothetical protein PLS84_03135 [Salinivirgaceae bacterium]|nr:hypothetical protein [Salinivirgaceae bacterium]
MKYKISVFCDTSFFVRLLDKNDALCTNAKGYFRYFTENKFNLMISTIAIAEYCIRGNYDDLPVKKLLTVTYDLDHALRTSEFARIAFQARQNNKLQVNDRNIIPNDTKLFAQADCAKADYYITSDSKSVKVYNAIKEKTDIKFQFIDLNTPYNQTFGVLDL